LALLLLLSLPCADLNILQIPAEAFGPNPREEWELVRHLPGDATQWYDVNDDLKGFCVCGVGGTGTFSEDVDAAAFCVPYDAAEVVEFLFTTGNGTELQWLVASAETVLQCCYQDSPQAVIRSSKSLTPTTTHWYNRVGNMEDPRIMLVDDVQLVYREHADGLADSPVNGANVYVRKLRSPPRPPPPPGPNTLQIPAEAFGIYPRDEWELVRHLPSTATHWYDMDDNLRGECNCGAGGTNHGGTFSEDVDAAAFCVPYDAAEVAEFLFTSGNGAEIHWLVASAETVLECCYTNEPRPVIRSSASLSPTTPRWYNRRDNAEDPLISVIDGAQVVFRERLGGPFAGPVNGANVYVRKLRSPSPPPSPPPPPGVFIKVTFTIGVGVNSTQFDSTESIANFEAALANLLRIKAHDVRVTGISAGPIVISTTILQRNAPGTDLTEQLRGFSLAKLSQELEVTVEFVGLPAAAQSDGTGRTSGGSSPRRPVTLSSSPVQAPAILEGAVGGGISICSLGLLAFCLHRRWLRRAAQARFIESSLVANESFSYPLTVLRAADFLAMGKLVVFEEARRGFKHEVVDQVDEAHELFRRGGQHLIFVSHQWLTIGAGMPGAHPCPLPSSSSHAPCRDARTRTDPSFCNLYHHRCARTDPEEIHYHVMADAVKHVVRENKWRLCDVRIWVRGAAGWLLGHARRMRFALQFSSSQARLRAAAPRRTVFRWTTRASRRTTGACSSPRLTRSRFTRPSPTR
jgi:hypothetical protein